MKELKREKQLKKILKEELKNKSDRVAELEKELEKQTKRADLLESEMKEKDEKFLELYHENSSQHDKILELSNALEAEREIMQQAIQEGELNPKKAKKQLRPTQTQAILPTNDDSLAEMMVGYEKRIAEMLMVSQKLERDLLYKDEEIKSIKNIARDLAEQLEPVKRREEDYRAIITEKDQIIINEKNDKEKVLAEMQQIKDTLSQENKQNNILTDMKLEWEATVDRKDTQIHSFKEELVKLKDEIKGKDEAIKALSMTLIDKGKENERLTEMITEIKNHHLMTQILGQKFYVQK